jgi:hypothetical protein
LFVLFCSFVFVDIPKDCAEAFSWKARNGISYTKSGEYLINPSFDMARPFIVYCDFSDPTNRKYGGVQFSYALQFAF